MQIRYRDGSWQGFKTHIQRYPDDGLTVIVLANLAQARQSAIAYAVAGLYNRALTPPHRLEPKTGDTRTAELLKRFVETFAAGEGKDAALLTPGFASVATAEDRKQAAAMLKTMTDFTFVGCDAMGRVSVERYGAAVDRYCHAKVELPTGGRAMTFWLTKDDTIAGFTAYAY